MESDRSDFSDESSPEGESEDDLIQERQRDRGRKIDGSEIVAELMAIHERMMRDMEEHGEDADELDDGGFTEDVNNPALPDD